MSKTEMINPCVWLQTCDGSIQQVEQEIAIFCPFICQELIIQKGSSKSSPLCLPQQVTPSMLTLILEYCRFHHVQDRSNKERKLYDEKFVRMDPDKLCELTSAAKYLELKQLYDLTCRAIARIIEGKSPEEIREMFHSPDDLTKEEKLELMLNITCDPSIRLLNRLYAKKRKQLEDERITKNVEEKHVVDERSVDELLSFINGSNDGETKQQKTCKNKKKNRKKKDQQKNSSSKEDDDHVVEFDDEIVQALMAKIDREVEEFARRLNCPWEERKKEFLRDAGNHKEIVA